MQDWFTIETIDHDTYIISEYQHWEETHCYLICGEKRAMLIDTGLGVANIKQAIQSLTSLPVIAVTTHVHWDHIGGHHYFDQIGVFHSEKEWLAGQFPLPLQMVKQQLMHQPCNFPEGFAINDYQIFQGEPTTLLHDEDIIDLGNRQLKVIHTPGHSPGHCCFYEPDRGNLFTGDLIYKGCLDAYYPTTDPVQFMHSVSALQSLPIKKILPGHHQTDVPVSMIASISNAFRQLFEEEKLVHGSGIYDFTDFQIHI